MAFIYWFFDKSVTTAALWFRHFPILLFSVSIFGVHAPATGFSGTFSVPVLWRDGRVGRGNIESLRSRAVPVGGSLQLQCQAGAPLTALCLIGLEQQ